MRLVAIALAVIFFIVAALYLLPNGPLGHHVKHAVLFVVLAIGALVWLRFLTAAPGAKPRTG